MVARSALRCVRNGSCRWAPVAVRIARGFVRIEFTRVGKSGLNAHLWPSRLVNLGVWIRWRKASRGAPRTFSLRSAIGGAHRTRASAPKKGKASMALFGKALGHNCPGAALPRTSSGATGWPSSSVKFICPEFRSMPSPPSRGFPHARSPSAWRICLARVSWPTTGRCHR